VQLQGIRGRYLRTKSGLLFGRERDLETPSTTASMKNQRTASSRQSSVLFETKSCQNVRVRLFFFQLGKQSWVAAELLTASPTPRDHNCWAQNKKGKEFIRHACV